MEGTRFCKEALTGHREIGVESAVALPLGVEHLHQLDEPFVLPQGIQEPVEGKEGE